MWSGPRNISTAMMRAWENRPDCVVVDEPFYACYLHRTGLDHPAAQEVIDHGETDWQAIVHGLTQKPLPPDRWIFYQKQMTHHLLPEDDLDWLGQVANCFLIRDPKEVINSYIKVRPLFTLEDIGFRQQWRIFRHVVHELGQAAIVVDAQQVLQDPQAALSWLCEQAGVSFTSAMLSWPPGPRPSDGVWAKHWYRAVWRSTGFTPYQPKDDPVPNHLHDLWEEAEEIYQTMRGYALRK
jgi:hypothetical protein